MNLKGMHIVNNIMFLFAVCNIINLDFSKALKTIEEFKSLEKKIMRRMITEEGVRADGRKNTEVRPIWCEVGVLPRAHGSAIFTRGQTQVLSVCTVAGPGMVQELDGIDPQTSKKYMHSYAFPGFSVGEDMEKLENK